MTRRWYQDPQQIHELACWLDDRGSLPKAELMSLIEKPWQYEAEHEQMIRELMEQVAA